VQLCRYIVDVHNCCKDALSISLIILYDSCDYWENEIEKIIPKMPKIISLRNQRNHREIKAIHRRICQFITFISCADEFFKVFTKIFQLVFLKKENYMQAFFISECTVDSSGNVTK